MDSNTGSCSVSSGKSTQKRAKTLHYTIAQEQQQQLLIMLLKFTGSLRAQKQGLSYVPQQSVLIPTWAFRDCCCRCCLGTSTMIRLPPLTSGGQRTCPNAPPSSTLTLSLSLSTTYCIVSIPVEIGKLSGVHARAVHGNSLLNFDEQEL